MPSVSAPTSSFERLTIADALQYSTSQCAESTDTQEYVLQMDKSLDGCNTKPQGEVLGPLWTSTKVLTERALCVLALSRGRQVAGSFSMRAYLTQQEWELVKLWASAKEIPTYVLQNPIIQAFLSGP
jgi:hypothetical protein